MSFYIKLFVLVILGTALALVTINTLVLSTDDLSERFSTPSTSYLDRNGDGGGSSGGPERVHVDLPDALVRARSAADIEVEKERGTGYTASISQQKMTAEDPNTALAVTVEENAEIAPDELVEIVGDDAAEKEIGDEIVSTNEQPAGNGTISRSDSDADIKAMSKTTNTQTDIDKPEKPETGITKTKTQQPKIKKRAKTVRALDLAYAPPAGSGCTFPDNNVVRVAVEYRPTSYAIKGQSLTSIDQLIRLYKKCGGGKMLVLQNNEGLKETEERLIQLRKDEVKYYLLQRRVPKDDMIFSDNS